MRRSARRSCYQPCVARPGGKFKRAVRLFGKAGDPFTSGKYSVLAVLQAFDGIAASAKPVRISIQ